MAPQPLIKAQSHDVRAVTRVEVTASHVWLRRALFGLGDLIFLIVISAAALSTMHFFHKFGWNLAFTMVIGMAAAMMMQILLSIAATPILGSIESSVPSMIVAMLCPMAVCALELFGHTPTSNVCLMLGVAFGLGMFVFMKLYELRCRGLFCRSFSEKGAT